MSRVEIEPALWLDHRRAVYLEAHRALCVADVHLGYAWAQRHSGQLLPLHNGDDPPSRLLALCAEYRPERVIVLGDLAHRAVPLGEVRAELSRFMDAITATARLDITAGNHDRGLESLLPSRVRLQPVLELGRYLLFHGDSPASVSPAQHVLMGHEHPAVRLGDGIAGARYPCFMHGPRVTVLPAFSSWAAGTEISRGKFMSETARQAEFATVVAILGDRLLPLRVTAEGVWR